MKMHILAVLLQIKEYQVCYIDRDEVMAHMHESEQSTANWLKLGACNPPKAVRC